MSWLWHKLNRDPVKRSHQCYYKYHCIVCWLRTLLAITKHSTRARSAFLLITATAITVTLALAYWLMEVLRVA